MINKLKYLIGVSLKRKLKTKWFLIANLVLAIVIVGVVNIDSIITAFGGDFNDKTNIHVIDNINAYDTFTSQIDANNMTIYGNTDSKFIISKYEGTLEEAKAMLTTDKEEYKSMVLVIDSSKENIIDVTLVTNEYLELIDLPVLNGAINSTKTLIGMEKYHINQKDLALITSSVEVNRVILNSDKKSEEENMEMVMSTVFPIVILPFFMLSIFLIQMIGSEVNDEKTTKGMEIIISNVSPKTHFFSKVIAGNLFVMIQGVLLLIYGGIALLVRNLVGGTGLTNGVTDTVTTMIHNVLSNGLSDKLIYIIPLTLILMLLTFLAYSLIAGILASMTTNIEDFQQIQAPIMVVMVVGYYLSIMAGVFKGATFIKILGYVPFISAILSPSLLVLGDFGVIDIIIAIVITIGVIYLLIKYGLKVYKVGILNYSSSDLWKKMFKAIKE